MTIAKAAVEELIRRQEGGDETVLDDLIAEDFVNHMALVESRTSGRGRGR